MVFDEGGLIKCIGCRRMKTIDFFKYGCMNCDKCMDYKREWNKKRAEEEERLRPTTVCEICNIKIKKHRWQEHIRAKPHRIEALRTEYKKQSATANDTDKDILLRQLNKDIKEVMATPYEILFKDLNP